MLRKLACVLALVPGFWLATAQALGLGEIDVRSKLNQRFLANIPVVAAGAADSETLTLKLASPDDFARAGIERADFLSSLDFSFVPGSNVVRVTSRQSVRDPFLNFIVEARWNGGRLLREYTVLLDPPADGTTEAPASVPAAAPRVEAAPATVVEKPAASSVKPAAKSATATPSVPAAAPAVEKSGSYGPVHASETLWSIAAKLRPNPGVNMDQMLLAIYQGNPQAFDGGINGLLKGSRLKVPTEAEINAVDAVTAKARVEQLRGISGKTEAAPAPASAPTAVAKPPVAVPPASEAASKPVVTPAAPAPAPAVAPAAKIEPAPAVTSAPAAAAPVAPPPATPPATTTEAAPPSAAVSADAPNAAVAASEPKAAEAPAPATDAKPAGNPPAAAPVTPAEDFLSEFQLPLLAILLLLAIGAFVFYRVRRARAEKDAAYKAPMPASALRSMDDSNRAAGADAVMPPRSPRAETASESLTEKAAPAAAVAAVTAAAVTAADSLLPPLVAPAATSFGATPDFDQALRAGAQTVAVNHDASDPMTEADFHIAYGLYDEAAQMLKAAAEKDPDRVELRTKLAETYFAASKPVQFQEVAESLQHQVGRGEWERIFDMGRKLCPDSRLFQNSMTSNAAVADAVATPLLSDVEFEATKLSVIDFDLDAELASSAPAAAAAEPALAPDGERVGDIDLSSFDLDAAEKSSADGLGHVDFNLEELDLGKFDEAEQGVTAGDEIDTKLDLARAYADMGDNDAARSLLTEVVAGGTDKQKLEAEALQKRLEA